MSMPDLTVAVAAPARVRYFGTLFEETVPSMQPENKRSVVAIFREVAAFEHALDSLLKAGFDASTISVLGNHEAIVEHFGRVPKPDEMADAADTPREALDTEVALHKAIDFIAGTLALISEVGAAAAAYAVGGPIGVAAGSADLTDTTVDGVLSGYVDGSYHERFEENVRDGGVICWVHVADDAETTKALQVLASAGGEHIHETEI